MKAVLKHARLEHADLSGAKLEGAVLTQKTRSLQRRHRRRIHMARRARRRLPLLLPALARPPLFLPSPDGRAAEAQAALGRWSAVTAYTAATASLALGIASGAALPLTLGPLLR
ncbi:pentapeptide repeat-containing protein [Streptomyces sp. NPDC057336]|uniref:pentapeptide repeat-containing protein n=1 Tax=Streptomyces sp. NPDC057336 TaxID=3346102 RepID=UPI00362A0802